MKALRLLLVLPLLMLVGCNDSPKRADKPAPERTDYLSTAVKNEKRAFKAIDVVAVNKAIETFYVQEGRFPKKLEDLVDLQYLPLLPELPDGASWVYDTNTGIASVESGQ